MPSPSLQTSRHGMRKTVLLLVLKNFQGFGIGIDHLSIGIAISAFDAGKSNSTSKFERHCEASVFGTEKKVR